MVSLQGCMLMHSAYVLYFHQNSRYLVYYSLLLLMRTLAETFLLFSVKLSHAKAKTKH